MSPVTLVAGFDIETTGLIDPAHRIIEIALIVYELGTGVQRAKFVRRFNPGRPIDPKAQEVHGITFEDVAHLPLLEDDELAIKAIQTILEKVEYVVAHNGDGFDVPFLQQEFARIGRPLPPIKCIDTCMQARWATPLGKIPNLGELAFACEVPYDPAAAHAADYDVDVMMKCFFAAYKLGFYSLHRETPERKAA